MHIKVIMRYHFTLVRVENTGNIAMVSIVSRERLSSDVRYFHLWESNLVAFATKLKIRYAVTKIPTLCYINKSNNQLTAASFVWQRARVRMNGHKQKKRRINGGPSTPWTKVQPLRRKAQSHTGWFRAVFPKLFSGSPIP